MALGQLCEMLALGTLSNAISAYDVSNTHLFLPLSSIGISSLLWHRPLRLSVTATAESFGKSLVVRLSSNCDHVYNFCGFQKTHDVTVISKVQFHLSKLFW